jgi:AcrR family transcriptional regulator
VAQVKKSGVREAILESAFERFSRNGYTATSMAEIARGGNMTVANLYVYFDSKMAILYEIYRPWLEQQLAALAASVRKFRSPRARLRRLFIGLWGDIPAADHAFAHSLIEALASAPRGQGKTNNLLAQVETFLTELLCEVLPPERMAVLHGDLLSHVLWMAFDGFVINQRIGDSRPIDLVADVMADLLVGSEQSQ